MLGHYSKLCCLPAFRHLILSPTSKTGPSWSLSSVWPLECPEQQSFVMHSTAENPSRFLRCWGCRIQPHLPAGTSISMALEISLELKCLGWEPQPKMERTTLPISASSCFSLKEMKKKKKQTSRLSQNFKDRLAESKHPLPTFCDTCYN